MITDPLMRAALVAAPLLLVSAIWWCFKEQIR